MSRGTVFLRSGWGFKVTINFEYLYDTHGNPRATRCNIKIYADKILMSSGMSFCHPDDVFDKQKGREYALVRAIDDTHAYIQAQIWRIFRGKPNRRIFPI